MSISATPTTPSPGPGYAWDGTRWIKLSEESKDKLGGTTDSTGTKVVKGAWNTPEQQAAANAANPNKDGTIPTAATAAPGGNRAERGAAGQYDEDAKKAEDAYGKVTEAVTGTPGHWEQKGLQSDGRPFMVWIPDSPGSATVPRAAPQATPGTGVTSDVIEAAQPKAATAVAPAPITAPSIDGTTIAPVERFSGSKVAGVPGAVAGTATAATLNTAPQDQVRDRQLALLTSLEGIEKGTGAPSLAELQGQRQAAQAVSDQNSLAAQSHGYGGLAAQQTAGRNIARIESQAAGDAAMLRAKEITDARQQLLTGLEGTRGQDVTVASKTADLTQGANLLNAENTTKVSISNADREAMLAKTNAELEQDAAKGNALAQNELSRRNAELEADRKKTEAGLGVDVAKSNQDTGTKVALANAANETQTNIVGATEMNKVGMSNAENDLRGQMANADNETKVALANAGFTLEGRRIDDERNVQAVRAMLDAQEATLKSDQQRIANQMAREQYEDAVRRGDRDFMMKIIGGLLQAGGTIAAAAISDRRAKTDIKPLYSDDRGKTAKVALLDHVEGKGGDPIGDLLDALHPVTYRYKDPKAEGAAEGQRYGIIAQDLEKSPMGKSIVMDDGGVKKIDTAQAVGVLLAAMARMRQQMKGKRA